MTTQTPPNPAPSVLMICRDNDGTVTCYIKGPAAKMPLTAYVVEPDAYGDREAAEVGVEPWADAPAKAKRAVKELT